MQSSTASSAASRPPRPIEALHVTAWTASSAAGQGRQALQSALATRRSGLTPNDFTRTPLRTCIGRITELEHVALPPPLARWDCRNNRLAWLALNQDGFLDAALAVVRRHGPTRVAVVMGTSTSSIGASEAAYAQLTPQGEFPPALRRQEIHTPHSLGGFVQAALGTTGPCYTVATACSSSAKVFAQAERLMRLGLVDAAVVGGVDSLCQSILYGFNALQLVAPGPCRPFDAGREGINLAEAGGYALLERAGAATRRDDRPWLRGYGESSDAHHLASPHPQGLGAQRAAEEALARAGLGADAIDYINLHGTATPKNDAVEAGVVAGLFGPTTRASSTKGWTGHTLGAAGILDAVIVMLALRDGLLPGTLNCREPDPDSPAAFREMLLLDNLQRAPSVAMSNSFGFGGSNCALVFGRESGAKA